MLLPALVFLFGYFLQCVTADALSGLLQPHGLLGITNSRVYGRQAGPLPNVPAECKSGCDPVLAKVAQGCSPAECCQDSFVNGYFECLTCVGTAENITDYGPAQQVVDQLTVQCNTEGFESPKLTLPGIDPNRTLPSSVPPLLTGTLPPTATNQETRTALPTITPATSPSGTAPPSTTSSPSSAIPNHFFTPQLSHLSAYVVSSIILVHFVG